MKAAFRLTGHMWTRVLGKPDPQPPSTYAIPLIQSPSWNPDPKPDG